jgi:hypothetical protein
MKKVKTYTAQIYVGLREGYGEQIHSIGEVWCVCQEFVNKVGFCVTVTPTQFLYMNGMEPGAIVGTINYPRFPSSRKNLKTKTLQLATNLMLEFKQCRVSVVFPDETIMLENIKLEGFRE